MGSSPRQPNALEPGEEPERPTSLVVPTGRRPDPGPPRTLQSAPVPSGRHPRPAPYAHRTAAEVTELLPRLFPRIWRTAHRFGFEKREAEEAAQRAFSLLAERIQEIEPGRECRFLVGVVGHLAANARRQRRKRRQLEHDEVLEHLHAPNPNPEEIVARRRARTMLEGILERLPQPNRQVFVLFELEETPLQEIADTLGLPVGTVATRLRRARELFQHEVQVLRSQDLTLSSPPGGEEQ